MATGSVVGGLRGVLELDTSKWAPAVQQSRSGLSALRTSMEAVTGALNDLSAKLLKTGAALTVGLTVPMGLMGAAARKAGADFQQSMNGVQAALRGITPDKLKALSDQAQSLGPKVGKTAVQAAEGIEALGLAGMSTATIINGGLASALTLAAANSADVAASGALANDVMSQFGMTAKDLPQMVDRITGALDAGKFGFDDYRLAASQAGAVAGSLGVEFDDFNVAIAALSSRFSSGSDAGTSFATMIRAIVAPTDESEKVMAQLGKRLGMTGNIFLDAQGNMKSLAEWSEILRKAMVGVSEGQQGEVLTKLFGGDGMRAAIALMEQGSAGIERLRETVNSMKADSKVEILRQGDIAATENMVAAYDRLKIAIADTGLLAAFTSVKNAITGVLNSFASMPPALLKGIVAIGALTAALGPLLIVLTTVGKAFIMMRLTSLGPLMFALSALINPVGTLVAVLVRLGAVALGIRLAGTALGLLATYAGPVGAVVMALGFLVNEFVRVREASADTMKATAGLTDATDAYTEAANLAATASGKERDEALKNAAAKREQARQTMASARAKLVEAQASASQMEAEAQRAYQLSNGPADYDGGMGVTVASTAAENARKQALANAAALKKSIQENMKAIADSDRVLSAAASAGGTATPFAYDLTDPRKERKGRKATGPTAAELAERREGLRLQSQLDIAREKGDVEEQRRIERTIDLRRSVADWIDAGLSRQQAMVQAESDLAALDAARGIANRREIDEHEDQLDLQLAEMRGDQVMIDLLNRKADKAEQVAFFRAKGVSAAQAEEEAELALLAVDKARAEQRARRSAADERSRQVDLARLRGDTDQHIRALEAAAKIADRTEELTRDGMKPEDARDRAVSEIMEEDQAHMQGVFRDTIKGGMRAALDSNLGDFAKNWWKERMAKGMEEALNSLADLIANLFSKVNIGGGTGAGGGGLGSILKGLGGLFGGGADVGAAARSGAMAALDSIAINAPGFATGGQFKVGGMSGIDKNLVSMRLTKGEMVDIRRPGQERAAGGDTHNHFTGNLLTPDFWAQIQAGDARAAMGGSQMAQQDLATRQRRQLR